MPIMPRASSFETLQLPSYITTALKNGISTSEMASCPAADCQYLLNPGSNVSIPALQPNPDVLGIGVSQIFSH
jgi:hypothetical protein